MKSFWINYDGNRVHYIKMGHGSESLLAFHGFGQDATVFLPISRALEGKYTIYAFDLFFHGKSSRNKPSKPVSINEVVRIAGELTKNQGITRFSLLGYSLGGKFVFSILTEMAENIDKVILIAPDGLEKNAWYRIATSFALSRLVFRFVTTHPSPFFTLAQALKTCRVIPKRVVKFALNQMETEEQRRKVFYSWISFRKLHPKSREFVQAFNNREIPLELFIGKYDQLFPREKLAPLVAPIKRKKIIVLPKGHNTLIRDVAEYYQAEREN